MLLTKLSWFWVVVILSILISDFDTTFVILIRTPSVWYSKQIELKNPVKPYLIETIIRYTSQLVPNTQLSFGSLERYNWLYTWAPEEIFPEGSKTTDTLKSWHVFGAPYKKSTFSARRRRKRKMLRFLRSFRLKYKVSITSAEGASEKFRVFCRMAAHDVIFSKFQGGGKCPPCPPASAHGYT